MIGVGRTQFRLSLPYVGRAMSFKILLVIALFAPLLLIAAGAIVHGPHREPRRDTELPP